MLKSVLSQLFPGWSRPAAPRLSPTLSQNAACFRAIAAAYAFGKSGSFLANYAYCVSLLIANIAIAISAVGYAVALFGLNTTPFETCLLTIAVLWICTVLNFKGAKITGLISNFTAWGVIIPVAGISVFGWFWFNPDTYTAAWIRIICPLSMPSAPRFP